MERSSSRLLPTPVNQTNLDVYAICQPFSGERRHFSVREGLTVQEILDKIVPYGRLPVYAKVFIGPVEINRAFFHVVRPKPGHVISIRILPLKGGGGGGGKNPLRTLLTIAVFAVAAYAASLYAVQLASTFAGIIGPPTALQVGIASAVIKAGVGAIGSLAVNAIAGPSKPKLASLSPATTSNRTESPTLFIQGARNQLSPYGVIPVVLGTHRIVPPQAAKAYTETSGNNQYSRQLFCWGYGDIELTDLKIGETPLTTFTGVETEHILDGDSTDDIALYPARVNEEGLSILLTVAGSWATRNTPEGAQELIVDVTFPRGLFQINSAGGRVSWNVTIEIRYRKVGDVSYTTQEYVITNSTNSALRQSYRFVVPTGAYEVGVRKSVDASDADDHIDELYWTALRAVEYGPPVTKDGLCLTALRILATDQLNGQVDQLSGLVSQKILDWDVDTQTWIKRVTTNPASIYRYVLQGTPNARPRTDDEIDLEYLQEWHEDCAARGFSYSSVIDYATTVDDILREVAAAGKASPTIIEGLYSVVMDRPQTLIVQHVTPRNSWGYEYEKGFPEIPHAFIVEFVNKDKDYIRDERVVFDDGYSAEGEIPGTVPATDYVRTEAPGIVDTNAVHRIFREYLAELRLRPDTHSFYLDAENLVAKRGDLIKFSHDIALIGLGWGRVKDYIVGGTIVNPGDPVEVVNPDSGEEVVNPDTLESIVSAETVPSIDDIVNPDTNEEIVNPDTYGVISIIVDEELEMEAGNLYGVRFRLQDGTSVHKLVTTVPGRTNTLSFPEPLDEEDVPSIGDLFQFGIADLETLDVIIRDIEPGPGLTAKLTCQNAAPEIFEASTGPIPDYDSGITLPPELQRVKAPIIDSVQTDEDAQVLNLDGSISSRMIINLINQNTYDVLPVIRMRSQGDSDYYEPNVIMSTATKAIVEGLTVQSIYEIKVVYKRLNAPSVVNSVFSSPAYRSSITFEGTSNVPDDITGFAISVRGDTTYLSWDLADEVDLDHLEVRFSTNLINPDWGSSVPINPPRLAPTDTNIAQPATIGSYLIKAFDRGGRASVNAAIVTPSISILANLNVIDIIEESDTFGGTFDNTELDSGNLKLSPGFTTGYYYFENYFDLGAVYTSVLSQNLEVTGENADDNIDDWSSIDNRESWDGTNPSQYTVTLQIRYTDDDPSGTPTWSEWGGLTTGDYTARAFEFRLVLVSLETGVTPIVSLCEVSIDMPDRTEGDVNVTVGTGGLSILYPIPFKDTPALGIAVEDLASGDRYEVTNQTASGFDIIFYDDADAPIERNFSYVARGYGYEV